MTIAEAPFRIPESPTTAELLAKYFTVLAHPVRLRILELLDAEGELSVGELVRRLKVPQPSVSNHLACLRWCGFVAARRDHRTVYNRVADPRIPGILALARELLEQNAEHVSACRRLEG